MHNGYCSPFRQIVKMNSMVVQGPADGTAPKTVKVYVNKPNLGFEVGREVCALIKCWCKGQKK